MPPVLHAAPVARGARSGQAGAASRAGGCLWASGRARLGGGLLRPGRFFVYYLVLGFTPPRRFIPMLEFAYGHLTHTLRDIALLAVLGGGREAAAPRGFLRAQACKVFGLGLKKIDCVRSFLPAWCFRPDQTVTVG